MDVVQNDTQQVTVLPPARYSQTRAKMLSCDIENRAGAGHRNRAMLLVCLAAVLLALLRPLVAAGSSVPTMQLDVLVYNIEYEGSPDTDAVMRLIEADIVGVLESYDRLPEIARETGYPYYNTSLQLLSKFPIHEPSGALGLYALIEVQPGFVVAFFNVHLDYVETAPGKRLLTEGESALPNLLEVENRVRASALERQFEAMKRLLDDGYPVFLTGDFNQPSSLDYPRPGVPFNVPWPVSEKLFELGFRDSFREIFPDPDAWPAATIGDAKSGNRIDYIYVGGPSTTIDSDLVGPESNPYVTIPYDPWTSDHRAIVSSFDVAPVAMPTMVSVDARIGNAGDQRIIRYKAPTADRNSIAIVKEGGDPASPLETLGAIDESGSVSFDTSDMDATAYEAVLIIAGAERARVKFQLRDPNARIRLTTDKPTYKSGESIAVSWTDGPGSRWDWLVVYRADASNPTVDDYLGWVYTDGHSAGTLPPGVSGSRTYPGESAQEATWPLPPGDYVLHYMPMDQYNVAGSVSIAVVP